MKKLSVFAAAALSVVVLGCATSSKTAAPDASSRLKIVAIAEACTTNRYVMSGRNASNAIAAAGYLPIILSDIADTNLLAQAMDRVDALVLTGSVKGDAYRHRIAFEHMLIRMALERGKPVLGFCHGHQCINLFFGGTVTPLDPKRTPPLVHRSKEAPSVRHCFHMIDIKPGSRLAEGYGATRYKVNSSHGYRVEQPGKGIVVTARAEDGTVEAIEHESLPVTGFQFHPEAIFDLDERHLRVIKDALEHPAAGRKLP